MKVAVLGCGSIAARHARNFTDGTYTPILHDTDERRMTTLAEQLARATDQPIQSVATLAGRGHRPGLVDLAPEAIVICTPAATHRTVAETLLAAGYRGPLFVEKPLATTVDDARWFLQWPHPTTMVGYNLRFHPFVQQAIALRPTHVDVKLECDMHLWPGRFYAAPWLECSHEVDLILHAGAPAAGYLSDGYTLRHRPAPAAVTATCYLDAGTPGRYHREWQMRGAGWAHTMIFSAPEVLGNEQYRQEIMHFLSHAKTGTPTLTPFADGVRVLDVLREARLI